MLEIYAGAISEEMPERKQLDELVRLLRVEYEKSPDICRVFLNCTITSEIDVLVFKGNRIVILELKNKGGKIKANTKSRDLPWILENGSVMDNAFFQVNRQRHDLILFFLSNILSDRIKTVILFLAPQTLQRKRYKERAS
ncbi:MAG: nuclease-related domain-containing protein [Nitrososphaerales archaeon]